MPDHTNVCGSSAPARKGKAAGLLAAAAIATAGLLATVSPALGASCPAGTAVTGSQSIDGVKTRVLGATNMTCSSARAVVARNGLYVSARGAYTAGGRFLLGAFQCTVTRAPRTGPVRARCVERRRAFTVAYRLAS